jgi:transposase
MAVWVRVELSAQDRAMLNVWINAGRTEQRLAKRAKVILLSAEKTPLAEIAERTGLTRKVCSKWRKRFATMGIAGLSDMPGRGRPKVYNAENRVDVLALACTSPVDGSTRWSARKLAEATGLSKSTVHTILTAGRLKPHKTEYWCGKSPDPEFAEKRSAIVGLYLSPPENALVLCVDEKSQLQALDRTQPLLPMRPDDPARLTATYKRNGTTCLLAALAVHQGEIIGKCVDSANSQEFLKFLKKLYRQYPGKELHIIVDNLVTHKQTDVRAWVAGKKRVHMYFTPTYASWLNQIEIWFNIFTRDVLRGGVWPSKQALVNQIMKYIKNYNQLWAKPFRWTYTGEPLTA